MRSILILLVLLLIPFINGLSQNPSPDFDIHKAYLPLSIDADQLPFLISVHDLNPQFKASFVKEYYSINITGQKEGRLVSASSRDSFLTSSQLELLKSNDPGTEVSVDVLYLPQNNLKNNVQKLFDFEFIINPPVSAAFPGGDEALTQFLQDKIISNIAPGTFEGLKLAAYRFTVDETGTVKNIRIIETSSDVNSDAMIVTGISNMPCWSPAAYSDKELASQDYVLTIGSMLNCNANLLNIRL